MNTTFESWFASEQKRGLVDIKFAMVGGKGVSLRAIQDELLMAEAAVGASMVKPAPKATSTVPINISKLVAAIE